MAKKRIGYPEPEEEARIDSPFSLLRATRKINGEENYIFYIIPSWQEDTYTQTPKLLDTSLDAKEFFGISVSIYEQDKQHYDTVIDQRFEQLTECMGVITEDGFNIEI